MNHKMKLGHWGESAAETYLKDRGYEIIAKNWHCRAGEIDIIAMQNNAYVFVEVKTRSGTQYGFPEEAVHQKKRQAMINSALTYLQTLPVEYDWRIDIIAIIKLPNSQLEIEWFQNAIKQDE